MTESNSLVHDALTRTNSLLHVSTTGGGPTLQQAIWSAPGCSKYLVGFFTPYSRTQLHSFLGHPPEDSYVCEEVAFDLAMASYIRASEHKVEAGVEGEPVGMGITAAMASSRMPRGEQQAFLCIITKDVVSSTHIPFTKAVGEENRLTQDKTLSMHAQAQLLLSLESKPDFNFGDVAREKALERFYRYPVFHTNGTRHPRSPGGPGAVYLPATLNPIHDGHRAMAEAAETQLSENLPGRIKARYLVSSTSPHKGSLTVQEMLFKAGMLRAERWKNQSRMVEFTHDEPLFLDKARRRPGSIFLIGADTMERMLDPKWGTDIDEMLREMKNLEVKFLVMGRVVDGEFKTCRDIEVPWPHGNLFEPLEGRLDLSSSQIREAAAQ